MFLCKKIVKKHHYQKLFCPKKLYFVRKSFIRSEKVYLNVFFMQEKFLKTLFCLKKAFICSKKKRLFVRKSSFYTFLFSHQKVLIF
jgi:hypothetical protein